MLHSKDIGAVELAFELLLEPNRIVYPEYKPELREAMIMAARNIRDARSDGRIEYKYSWDLKYLLWQIQHRNSVPGNCAFWF